MAVTPPNPCAQSLSISGAGTFDQETTADETFDQETLDQETTDQGDN